MTKNQIIDEEIKQAIKELTNMLEELNLSEIQIENDKIGKVVFFSIMPFARLIDFSKISLFISNSIN